MQLVDNKMEFVELLCFKTNNGNIFDIINQLKQFIYEKITNSFIASSNYIFECKCNNGKL